MRCRVPCVAAGVTRGHAGDGGELGSAQPLPPGGAAASPPAGRGELGDTGMEGRVGYRDVGYREGGYRDKGYIGIEREGEGTRIGRALGWGTPGCKVTGSGAVGMLYRRGTQMWSTAIG